MAEERLNYSQVAEPNLLDPLIKEFQNLIQVTEKAESAMKQVVAETAKLNKETPLDSFENIEKREKAIRDNTSAIKQLDKLEKDRLRLLDQQRKLQDSRAQANAELSEKIRQQTKFLRENAKANVVQLDNYEKLIQRQKESEKELLRLTATFGKNSEVVQESRESYLKLTDEIKGINDVRKEEKKAASEIENLQRRLSNLTSDSAKEAFELKEQIRLQSKELRDNAKEAISTRNAYQNLVKQTNEAQAEFKRVSARLIEIEEEFGNTSDEALNFANVVADAEKSFVELDDRLRSINDSARDGRRDVGRYEKGFEEIRKEVTAAEKQFKELTEQFGENSVQARRAEKRYEELKEQLDDIKKSSADTQRGIKRLTTAFKAFASATIVLKIFELLNDAISQNSEGAAELQKIWVRVTGTLQVVAGRIVVLFDDLKVAFVAVQARFERFILSIQLNVLKFQKNLSDLGDGIKDFFGVDTSGSDKLAKKIADLQKEYEGLADQTEINIKAFQGMGDEIESVVSKQVALVDTTIAYRKEIAKNDQQINKNISSQQAYQDAFESSTLSLTEQIEAGVNFRTSLQQTQQLEEENARRRVGLARLNADANRNNIDAQEELIQAEREYVQLVADNASELAATENEIQQLRNDATQRNLDFYVDDAQNRIDTNQRIIDDETQTFARRRELLAQNDEEREEANRLRAEALNKTLQQMGKAELDFEDLRKRQSSEEIARIIEESGLNDDLAGRALEIIRERRTEIQDNTEAQRDLNAAEAESARILDDIALQEAALIKIQKQGVDLEKVLEVLAADRLQSEIDNLRERIAAAKEGSAERIALNQELNDKLLEQNQTRLDKEKAANEKALQDLQKGAEVAFEALGDALEQRSERRVAAIEEEIAAEQARLQSLQSLAAEGNEDAENNIALTEQRQRQLELEREQQIRRQQQAELALAAVQIYAAKTTAGDPNPLASTFADIEVLRAFIGSLSSFFEGTEDTGTVANSLDSNGGRLAILHNNERVMTAEQNRIIGSMSNAELTALAHRENTGNFKDQGSIRVFEAVQELIRVTKNSPVYLGGDWNQFEEMVTHRVKKGRTLEKRHIKKGGIWGK